MKIPLIFGLLCFLTPSAQASQDGKSLFESLCMSCHVVSGKPTVAPPVFGMKNHVMQAYPRREDFINYVIHWVKQPDASRSLMPGAVRRFGVMPALPYPEEQVRKVAGFLYDTNFKKPGWYRKHYEAEHGEPPKY
jgi:mono/diheme cytochrome c family protein